MKIFYCFVIFLNFLKFYALLKLGYSLGKFVLWICVNKSNIEYDIVIIIFFIKRREKI